MTNKSRTNPGREPVEWVEEDHHFERRQDMAVMGICGDEDGGALSSWYVFSAMGFYPLCPGRPIYGIGSPLFERTTIRLAAGGAFIVAARGVSVRNKYVQSAALNGRPLARSWFTHADLVAGGSLVLEMGPRTNPGWGSCLEDAPPSLRRPEI
ncbi:MAG: glycoside hydrolase family 92 protein [bacterium]|nr:glycoside hydrolase family 92 protein [bacterium]